MGSAGDNLCLFSRGTGLGHFGGVGVLTRSTVESTAKQIKGGECMPVRVSVVGRKSRGALSAPLLMRGRLRVPSFARRGLNQATVSNKSVCVRQHELGGAVCVCVGSDMAEERAAR